MAEPTNVAFRLRPNGERKNWLMIHWYEQQGHRYLAARLLRDAKSNVHSELLPLHVEALEAWLHHDPAWSVAREDWGRLRSWCESNGIPANATAAKSLESASSERTPMRSPRADEWADAAQRARSGDTDAARDILREFSEAVELSTENGWAAPVPWACAQYLAEAFQQILDGNEPARALHLRAPKAGRPAGAKTHDEVRLAAAYWLLLRRGHKAESAKQLIQNAVGADRRTVERAADSCSAFEDPHTIDEAILVAIVSEQSELAIALAGR